MSNIQKFIFANIVVFIALGVFSISIFTANAAPIDPETTQTVTQTLSTQSDLSKAAGYLAIAITMFGAICATGFAVAKVGSAAMGAISEKPEIAGKALIFVGLAEGIAIYGVLMSFLLLQALK